MTFGNPLALLGLLFIPALILLYFLKLKRRPVVVSSTVLWSRVLEDRRVNSPFQRFKKSLLLLLQILVVLFLTLALADPEMETENVPGRANLLLIDVSGSMAVEEDGRTRLEQAKRLALEYIEAMGEDERAAVIQFSNRAEALTPVTTDRTLLRKAIDSLELTPAPTDLADAMTLAASIAKNLGASPIDQVENVTVVFSDGGFPIWESAEVPLLVDYVKIGARTDNSGIVALASRMDFADTGSLQVYVEVKNFGEASVDGFVTIERDGVETRAAEAQIAPGENWSRSFETDFTGGLLTVVWNPSGDDALETDNRAWLEITPRRELTIWRIGDDNLYLDEALAAIPNASVAFVDAASLEEELASAAVAPDVILWDRVEPDALPTGVNHLMFAAIPPGVWDPETHPVDERDWPPVVSWDRSHPVNRYVNYSLLDQAIEKSFVFPRIPNSVPLLETGEGALISQFTMSGTRGVVVGFDSLRSQWPLSLSWPFFLFNALNHLAANEATLGTGARSGELLNVRVPGAAEEIRVTQPGGETEALERDTYGWVRYSKTEALGPYRFEWTEPIPGSEERVARTHFAPINLLWANESNISPRETLELSGSVVESTEARGVFRREFWPWVLLVALIILLVEWTVYHRR
ncbi:MAG: VWA domain-containing protein [Planctomycetota bacterium]